MNAEANGTATATPTTGERGQGGRFAKGNRGGPGRPSRATEANYLIAITEAIPLARWRKIVENAAEAAEKGDHQARAWLAKMLLGADPGRLSEAVAGEARDGPHFRVAEEIARRDLEFTPDEFDEALDPEAGKRRKRVAKLVKELGDPDTELAEGDEDKAE